MTLILFCSRKNEQDEGCGARFSGFRFSGFQLAREGGRLEGGKVGRFKVAGLKVVAGCILIPDSGPLTPAERLVTDCALPSHLPTFAPSHLLEGGDRVKRKL